MRPSVQKSAALACLVTLASSTIACAAQREISFQNFIIFSDEPSGAFQNVYGDKDWKTTFLWSGLDRFAGETLPTPGDAATPTPLDGLLRRECYPADGNGEKVFLPAVMSFLVGAAISAGADALGKELEKELKAYSAEYSGTAQTGFYRAAAAGQLPAQRWQCLRFTRVRTVKLSDSKSGTTSATPALERSVAFDLLLQVKVDGDGRGVRIRPLRIYLARATAKGTNVGIASSLKLEAIWRDKGEGKQATVFDSPVAELKFSRLTDGSDKPGKSWYGPGQKRQTPYYFWDKTPGDKPLPLNWIAWDKRPLLSYIPWVAPPGADMTTVNVTMKLAEAGDGESKKTLQFISKIFAAGKDDVTGLLSKAAKKLIDPEAPASPAVYCGRMQSDGQSWQIESSSCAMAEAQP